MKDLSIINRRPRVRAWLITVAIVFLCNPTVRLFDILPDFVSCFIIAHYLDYPAERAPFFKEARSAFMKLGVVSLFRIPAFFVSIQARSGNAADYDTSALLTFVFAVIEGIYLIGALANLFAAFFYLGERSDASSLISRFKVGTKSRGISPDALRSYSVFAVIFKLAAWSLPEFLLLTEGVDLGAYSQVIRPSALYPFAILLSVISSFFVMLILGRRFYFYISAIRTEGKFFSAVDLLITEEMKPALTAKLTKKDINSAFSIITASTFFSVILRFDNLREINLIPFGLTGVLIIFALIKLGRHSHTPRITIFLGAFFTVSAVISHVYESVFLDTYSYEMLVKNKLARAEYIPVIISCAVSCLLFVIFVISLGVFLKKLSDIHTGFEINGELDKKYMASHRRSMGRKIALFSVSAALVPIIRLLDTLFRYFPNLKIVSVEDGFGNVTFSLVPWFGVAVFLSSVLFFGVSFYLGSVFKEALELKYSEDL
ncbi:MAG: hypothetical protein J6Q85_06915 [Clostridia bacterium]|nr:hypothetical protein [Clostridia bacterium]